MSVPDRYLAQLKTEKSYHIYNRTNNKERLFREDADRIFFVQQYEKYLFPFLKKYAFNLLDNHFHFVVEVRSQAEIIEYLKTVDKKNLTKKEKYLLNNPQEDLWHNHFIEWQFLRLFTSYAQTFNLKYDRKGNLFHRPFKRVEIEDHLQFSQAIFYVHANAVKHHIIDKLENYKWSSFNICLSDEPSFIERDYLLDWFGGREMFQEYHKAENIIYEQYPFHIEDEQSRINRKKKKFNLAIRNSKRSYTRISRKFY